MALPSKGAPLSDCYEAVSSTGVDSLQKLIKTSLFKILKPESLEMVQVKPCGQNCLQLFSETPLVFQLKIDRNIPSPEISILESSKILSIPSEKFFEDPSSEDSLRFWLAGHELHPYSESPGKILYKSVQIKTLKAYERAVESGVRSFLHVAPTAVGKTLVLTKALLQRLRHPSVKKITIVTAHQIHLVNQLLKEIQRELKEENVLPGVELVNWRGQKQRNLNNALISALSKEGVSGFVMTSQSLKKQLAHLEPENYEELLLNLEGIFIDEVHHLGAEQTKDLVYGLFERSSGFLYGATATPVHSALSLSSLFESVHWSYLNDDEGDIFKRHSVGSALSQLSLGIEKGDLTSFDDLYVIGEKVFMGMEKKFREREGKPVFVKDRGLYVLNPEHYKSLARILSPLFEDNRKGFIVAATIMESERLAGFLNREFRGIEFSSYHSKLSVEERDKILKRSRESEGFHYIVAVKALDEGVNLPWLSAYIDLNANVSVKQMIHRVGRVLRLYPGKMNSDILFLTDYRDAEMASDLLELLDSVKRVKFSRGIRKSGGKTLSGLDGNVFDFTREDLLFSRELLEETARKSFWNKKPKPTLEEAVGFFKAEGVYGKKLEGEGLTRVYKTFREEHPEFNLPSSPSYYKNQGIKGFRGFFGLKELNWPTLEEAIGVFKAEEVHGEKLEGKNLDRMYKTFREEHPELYLPSLPSQYYKDQGVKDFRDFFGLKELKRLTLKEAVGFFKAEGVYGEKLKGKSLEMYNTFRAEHPELNLPFHPDQYYKDQGWKGFRDFFGLGRKKQRK